MDKDKIIYIVLGILWMIISGISKNKEKNKRKGTPPKQQPKPENTSDDMSLEDMIRALRGEPKPKKEPEPEPIAVVEEEPFRKTNERYNNRELKIEKVVYEKKQTAQTIKNNQNTLAAIKRDHKALDEEDYDDGITFHFAGEESEGNSIEFDARQAVIYHEIMKRPKY